MKNFFRKLINSFNPNFYKEIVFQSVGNSLKYWLVLFLLLAILFSGYLFTFGLLKSLQKLDLSTFFSKISQEILDELKIENGQIVVPSTFYKKEFDKLNKGKGVLIIDPKGALNEKFLEAYEFGFILSGNKLIGKQEKYKTEIYDLSEIYKQFSLIHLNLSPEDKTKAFSFTINSYNFSPSYKDLQRWIKIISFSLCPLFFLFFFFAFWIEALFKLFLFSLFSLIVNFISKAKLRYVHLLNIGIFAFVPPLILRSLLSFFIPINKISFSGWIFSLIYLGFIFLGILKVRSVESPLNR